MSLGFRPANLDPIVPLVSMWHRPRRPGRHGRYGDGPGGDQRLANGGISDQDDPE